MATERYFAVRNDIYRRIPTLNKKRSFQRMKKLFNWGYWILLLLLVISGISISILLYVFPNTFWWFIPVGAIFTITILHEVFGEKLYNPIEREIEIKEREDALERYVESVNSVLEDYYIKTVEQRKILLRECQERIEFYEKKYKSVNSKISNIMIGAPIGTLVSAIIYNTTKEVGLPIITVMVVGLLIIGVIYVMRKILYYSNGYFKDEYLMKTLKEIEYYVRSERSTKKHLKHKKSMKKGKRVCVFGILKQIQ